MQQQSVLVMALRGPDGIGKFHPIKQLTCWYRASVIKATYLGREMRVDESDNTTFMNLCQFSDDNYARGLTLLYFEHVDSLPHHAHLHFMHGAQIIGYKHPNPLFRDRWSEFYFAACDDMHVRREPEAIMDARLSDWEQRYWSNE